MATTSTTPRLLLRIGLRAALVLALASASACAPYQVQPQRAQVQDERTIFCEGPGSSRGPGPRGTADCFYVDRANLERFMSGQLRL